MYSNCFELIYSKIIHRVAVVAVFFLAACALLETSSADGLSNASGPLYKTLASYRNTTPAYRMTPKITRSTKYPNKYNDKETNIRPPFAVFTRWHSSIRWLSVFASREEICGSGLDSGLRCGSEPSLRWYFDSRIGQCATFIYLGCAGSDNNFNSYEHCMEFCNPDHVCPGHGKPLHRFGKKVLCGFGVGSCPEQYECELRQTKLSKKQYGLCCPSRAHICNHEPDMGYVCAPTRLRWYYNYAQNECYLYRYYGCGGNANNFATLEQCRRVCRAHACKNGEAAEISQYTGMLVSYEPAQLLVGSIGVSNICSLGNTCRFSTDASRCTCCGRSDVKDEHNLCPIGSQPYVEAVNNRVIDCDPHVALSCGAEYSCSLTLDGHERYVCCKSNSGSCPAGSIILIDEMSKLPFRCSLQGARSSSLVLCPEGYVCESNIPQATAGFCCSSATPILFFPKQYHASQQARAKQKERTAKGNVGTSFIVI